jgi:hypothetical protein
MHRLECLEIQHYNFYKLQISLVLICFLVLVLTLNYVSSYVFFPFAPPLYPFQGKVSKGAKGKGKEGEPFFWKEKQGSAQKEGRKKKI